MQENNIIEIEYNRNLRQTYAINEL